MFYSLPSPTAGTTTSEEFAAPSFLHSSEPHPFWQGIVASFAVEACAKKARRASGLLPHQTTCAGYVEHPCKKEAHGDERSGSTLLADGLIPEGTSSRNVCALWLCTSLSSAKQELQEKDPTQATCRLCERMSGSQHTISVTATSADAEERARLWSLGTSRYPTSRTTSNLPPVRFLLSFDARSRGLDRTLSPNPFCGRASYPVKMGFTPMYRFSRFGKRPR